MNLRSRIDRLAARLIPCGADPKVVDIIPEIGPVIEWETPTGLILRVHPDFREFPYEALNDEQRGLIDENDIVTIFALPRIGPP